MSILFYFTLLDSCNFFAIKMRFISSSTRVLEERNYLLERNKYTGLFLTSTNVNDNES